MNICLINWYMCQTYAHGSSERAIVILIIRLNDLWSSMYSLLIPFQLSCRQCKGNTCTDTTRQCCRYCCVCGQLRSIRGHTGQNLQTGLFNEDRYWKHVAQYAGYTQSHEAMFLFVLAFIAQWSAMSMYSLWSTINGSVPQIMLHVVTITANLGGVFNLCVFLFINGKQTSSSQQSSNSVVSNVTS